MKFVFQLFFREVLDTDNGNLVCQLPKEQSDPVVNFVFISYV